METSVISKLPARGANGCLLVAVHNGDKLPDATGQVDTDAASVIKNILKQGDLPQTLGSTALIQNVSGLPFSRIMLVRAGASKSISPEEFTTICDQAVIAIRQTGASTVISSLNELTVEGRDMEWMCQRESLSVMNAAYKFDGHDTKSKTASKSKKGPESKPALKKWMHLVTNKPDAKAGERGASYGAGISVGCDLARDLGNLAPNYCTPTYLAKTAKSMQKLSPKLKVSVLDEAQMQKLGMGALLSVSKGSRQSAKLICMEYRGGAKSSAPVVLLGKGITFDTGGISIKGSATMDEMKFDMCGAASVMGAMRTCVELDLKCNLIVVVAAAENMPDGDASRPGDVVTSMSGQTIEILNTDAEGRMVLCDALTWIEKFKPAAVIDVATLTGACIVALGHQTSALMANDQPLAEKILSASQRSGDKAWQLPLWDEYQRQLDSNFADMANIGGRSAGSITAGCFLSRFAKEYPWAHLDIAGIAWHSGKNKGSTGRPVPLLVQYVLDNHV